MFCFGIRRDSNVARAREGKQVRGSRVVGSRTGVGNGVVACFEEGGLVSIVGDINCNAGDGAGIPGVGAGCVLGFRGRRGKERGQGRRLQYGAGRALFRGGHQVVREGIWHSGRKPRPARQRTG